MMERKPLSTGSIVGAIVLLVVVLLGLYVSGYFVLGKYTVTYFIAYRNYSSNGQAFAYWPLARLEAAATGRRVRVGGPTKVYFSDGEVRQQSCDGQWVRP